ncbi:MAG: hypothetical protein WA723_20890, partial [Pseudolabrys sp.]
KYKENGLLKQEEGAIPVTSCASLYAEDYAGSVEVYHISERRLCHPAQVDRTMISVPTRH